MPDHDSLLPPMPDLQLQVPELSMRDAQPSTSFLTPPLAFGGTLGFSGIGGGSPDALTDALGHYADSPAGPAAPGPHDMFAPLPASPDQQPYQLSGLGPFSNSVNRWLKDPAKVAEQEQRVINNLPPTDPVLAKQQTILHAPQIKF